MIIVKKLIKNMNIFIKILFFNEIFVHFEK